MADVFIATKPLTVINYSIADGRIRSFLYYGELLYDEDRNINIDGWQDRIVEIVINYGFNIDEGMGLKAFIHKMIDDGLSPNLTKQKKSE